MVQSAAESKILEGSPRRVLIASKMRAKVSLGYTDAQMAGGRRRTVMRDYSSEPYPLDLVQGDPVAGAKVEPGGLG